MALKRFGTIILLLVAFVSAMSAKPEPARTSAQPTKDGREAVAVLDFTVGSGDTNRWEWAAGGLADLLQIELQQRGLAVLDRDLIHAVLKEQRLAADGITAQNYLSLARLINARHLIAGRVTPLAQGRCRIEATAFSVEAIETVVTAEAEGVLPREMPRLLRDIADQLCRKLSGVRVPESGPSGAAPKPESLIMFYRGLNACARGQPELGAPWFINAADLDPGFTAPLLWEIKAYELAGFERHAEIRREETAAILRDHAPPATGPKSPGTAKPVLAVLNPVLENAEKDYDPATATSLTTSLKEALLATGRVRLFAFENIGEAVAEQDLTLSSFFATQYAPRYGRWLASDALVLCRLTPDGARGQGIDLALLDPLSGDTLTRIQRSGGPKDLSKTVRAAATKLVNAWMNQKAKKSPALPASELPPAEAEDGGVELRPAFRSLAAALAKVRRQPGRSDLHHELTDAFASTSRSRLAALEIERCLETLDSRAPGADQTYAATYRWLFWEPSPASTAAGLVDPRAIEKMTRQLFTAYPRSLAAGCVHYGLAVSDWKAGRWLDAAEEALQARRIIEALPTQEVCEKEVLAATYFLQGAGLNKLGRTEEARSVFRQGLKFMDERQARDFCLPLGPNISDRIYGYGGDAPGIRTRIQSELAAMDGNPAFPTNNVAGRGALEDVASSNAPAKIKPDWLQLASAAASEGRDSEALSCYQKALAEQTLPAQCPGLIYALLEVALDKNPSHPAEEFENLRREMGFPLVEPSWVEWFAAGRKYQAGLQFDLDKAVICYSNMIAFLENPERGGSYHLERHAQWVTIRWGPDSGQFDGTWSQNYDSRWYSAAFYLAESLAESDRKEEAAEWLRRIALKAGGDQFNFLLEAGWYSTRTQRLALGVLAADRLKELHAEGEQQRFGYRDGPYKLPPFLHRAPRPRDIPMSSVRPEVLRDLTNTLMAAGSGRQDWRPGARHPKLQALVNRQGRDAVPALLSLLPSSGGQWDEPALAWILERTATAVDAPWLVAACGKRWELIGVAAKLDPDATAQLLAVEWRDQAGSPSRFVHYDFIDRIIAARLRRLYPLVLDHIARKRANYRNFIPKMDAVVREEQSDELTTAFREAVSCVGK